MNETQGTKHIGRSIIAVLVGALAGIILTLGTDAALQAMKVFPRLGGNMSDGLFALATVYRTIYSIAGCYIAARLAPSRPMFHALVLGAIGTMLSLVGVVISWNAVPSLGPHWYPIALAVLAMPQAWVGGALREMQLRGRASG